MSSCVCRASITGWVALCGALSLGGTAIDDASAKVTITIMLVNDAGASVNGLTIKITPAEYAEPPRQTSEEGRCVFEIPRCNSFAVTVWKEGKLVGILRNLSGRPPEDNNKIQLTIDVDDLARQP
jgi:hypothetical protein